MSEAKGVHQAKLLWVYDGDEDDEGCVRLHVNTDTPYTDEAVDRLGSIIDAAPDLLEACLRLIDVTEQLIPEQSARGVADVVLAQARAAIAKATP